MRENKNGPKICANVLLWILVLLNILLVVLPFIRQFKATTWFPILQTGLEGALAGACADWFAVTALFSSPLGLRLPHTSIIPRSQQQIADRVSKAISEHFLSDRAILECLKRIDLADHAANWIESPSSLKAVIRLFADKIKALPESHVDFQDAEGELHEEERSPRWLSWLNRVQKDYMDEIIPDTGKMSGGKWKLWKRKNWSAWVYKYFMSADTLSAKTLIEGYFLKDYDFTRRKKDVQTLKDLMHFFAQQTRESEWLEAGSPRLESWALKLSPKLRSLLEGHIKDSIEAWDKDYLSDKVDSLLGRHLAYIRINGTICGFVVGALLGAVHLFLN